MAARLAHRSEAALVAVTSSRSCARSKFAAEARERCRPERHIYRTQASWPSCRSCRPPSPRASAAELPCPEHCVVLLSANAVPIVVARKADRESPRRRTHAPLCAPAQALSVSSQRNCVSTLQRAMGVHHLADSTNSLITSLVKRDQRCEHALPACMCGHAQVAACARQC